MKEQNLSEITTVGNLAPTVDYLGHVSPIRAEFIEPGVSKKDGGFYPAPEGTVDSEIDGETKGVLKAIELMLSGVSVRAALLGESKFIKEGVITVRGRKIELSADEESLVNRVIHRFDRVTDLVKMKDFIEVIGDVGGDSIRFRVYRDGKVVER